MQRGHGKKRAREEERRGGKKSNGMELFFLKSSRTIVLLLSLLSLSPAFFSLFLLKVREGERQSRCLLSFTLSLSLSDARLLPFFPRFRRTLGRPSAGAFLTRSVASLGRKREKGGKEKVCLSLNRGGNGGSFPHCISRPRGQELPHSRFFSAVLASNMS